MGAVRRGWRMTAALWDLYVCCHCRCFLIVLPFPSSFSGLLPIKAIRDEGAKSFVSFSANMCSGLETEGISIHLSYSLVLHTTTFSHTCSQFSASQCSHDGTTFSCVVALDLRHSLSQQTWRHVLFPKTCPIYWVPTVCKTFCCLQEQRVNELLPPSPTFLKEDSRPALELEGQSKWW